MIWQEKDLMDIAKNIKPMLDRNSIFFDLTSIESNGHILNKDNGLVECIRITSKTQKIILNTLTIEISSDNSHYKKIDKNRLEIDKQGRLEANLCEEYVVRYIRIFVGEDFMEFIGDLEVEVLNRKFPCLLVAARSDGFGARMLPILNALYLAEKTGFKFGFVWETSDYDQMSLKDVGGNKLEGISVGTEDFIFDKSFIESYSYLDKIAGNALTGLGLSGDYTIEELSKRPFEEKWGYYVQYSIAVMKSIIGDDDSYLKEYPRLFKKIKFSKTIQKVIDEANFQAKKLSEFVAIHIRAGDSIFDAKIQLHAYWKKAMPAEIAMEIIEEALKSGKNILLFGDDISEIQEFKKYYGEKIHLSSEFASQELSGVLKLIFDIILMSNAQEIYSAGSSFGRTAAHIGLGRYPKMWYTYYNHQQKYEIIQKNFDKINQYFNLHPNQRAYSLFALCSIATLLRKNGKEWIGFANRAIEYDKSNIATYIHQFNALIFSANYKDADLVLQNEIFIRNEKLEGLLKRIIRLQNVLEYRFFVGYIFKFASIHYPNISLLAAYFSATEQDFVAAMKYLNNYVSKNMDNDILMKILKMAMPQIIKQQPSRHFDAKLALLTKENDTKQKRINELDNAKTRIHSHLAYKLGSAMILNARSFLGWVRMPYVLSYIKESHREEQRKYQERVAKNPSLKLPKLESYPDYKEAIKEKQCFTYKLGEALIKANNVRGGGRIFAYLRFFQEVRELRKEFRGKIKSQNKGENK